MKKCVVINLHLPKRAAMSVSFFVDSGDEKASDLPKELKREEEEKDIQ